MKHLIYNEDRLKSFLDNVLYNPSFGDCPPNIDSLPFCLIMVARTKYLKDKKDLDMRNNFQFYKAIVRKKEDVVRKIKQFNIEEVYDRSGKRIPHDMMCVYMTLSPRDSKKAMHYLMKSLVDLSYKTSEFPPEEWIHELNRLDVLTFSAYHKYKINCQRAVIDFDLEEGVDKEQGLEKIKEILKVSGIKTIVETHGGFHVYLDLTKLDKEEKRFVFQEISKMNEWNGIFKEVETATDKQIVLPGTLQGGFEVKERGIKWT